MAYPKINLSQMLEQTAAKLPGATALIYFGSRISYADLLEQVNRTAAGFQALGVRKGDRVAVMMPNCPQFVIAYFGALKAGAIVTATSPIYTPREAAHQWKDAGASVAIVDRRLLHIVAAIRAELPDLRHVIEVGLRDYYPQNLKVLGRKLRAKAGQKKPSSIAQRPSPMLWQELLSVGKTPRPVPIKQADIACLQYTGGTTGSSKGAMLTHGNLVINANQTRQWLSANSTGPDVMRRPTCISCAIIPASVVLPSPGGE